MALPQGVVNQRTVVFEARVRDLSSNEIVATFADRNMQDVDPLDLTRLTWYGPAKQIIDQWAKEFVEIANRKPSCFSQIRLETTTAEKLTTIIQR